MPKGYSSRQIGNFLNSLYRSLRENGWDVLQAGSLVFSIFVLPFTAFFAFSKWMDLGEYALLSRVVFFIMIGVDVFCVPYSIIKRYRERKHLDAQYLMEKAQRERIREQEEKEKARKKRLILASRISDIDMMDPWQFEEYISFLYQSKGYRTELTRMTGDFGADVLASKPGEKICIQVKHYSSRVSIGAIQEVVSARQFYQCSKALVVTNNEFTNPAKQLAEANSVELVNREKLIELSAEYNQRANIGNNGVNDEESQSHSGYRSNLW